jgi:hypothetical protein
VPVGGVARQTRDFQTEHDARFAQSDFGHEPLEALTIHCGSPRLPQVAVDDDDPIVRPPQGDSMLAQAILPFGALRVLEHLTERGLPDVEIGVPLQMVCIDLLV